MEKRHQNFPPHSRLHLLSDESLVRPALAGHVQHVEAASVQLGVEVPHWEGGEVCVCVCVCVCVRTYT